MSLEPVPRSHRDSQIHSLTGAPDADRQSGSTRGTVLKTQDFVRPPTLWPFNILFGPTLLAVVIVVATLLTDRSYASFTSSNLMTRVFLSNGARVTMAVTLADSPADVRHAVFVLRVPRGISAEGVGYDNRGAIESVRVTGAVSRDAGEYTVSAVVQTGTPGVAMTVSATVAGAPCRPGQVTQTGATGTVIVARMHC